MKVEILPNAVYISREVVHLLHISQDRLLKKVRSGEIVASRAGNKNVYLGKDLLQYLENTKIIAY